MWPLSLFTASCPAVPTKGRAAGLENLRLRLWETAGETRTWTLTATASAGVVSLHSSRRIKPARGSSHRGGGWSILKRLAGWSIRKRLLKRLLLKSVLKRPAGPFRALTPQRPSSALPSTSPPRSCSVRRTTGSRSTFGPGEVFTRRSLSQFHDFSVS